MGESPRAPHVIVVGGGIAGLVAARELVREGIRVTLLEASGRLGGKLRSHRVAGIDLDAGAESFATRSGTVAALLAEIGLRAAVVTPSSAGAWLLPRHGGARPLPRAGLLGIPSAPLAREVIAVVGLAGALRAGVDLLLPASVGSRSRDLATLVRIRMGRAVLDRLVSPITTAVHSRDPAELALEVVAPRLIAGMLREGSLARAVQGQRGSAPAGSAVQGIDGGMFRLVDALAAALDGRADIRLGTRVSEADATGVRLADGTRLDADHVVIATELGDPTGEPITLATLVVDCPALDAAPRGTGVIVAGGPSTAEWAAGDGDRASDRAATRPSAKALTHASSKWEWVARAAAGKHVLRLSYARAPESDAGLQELARADAAMLLGVELRPDAIVGFDRQEWRGAGAPPGPVEPALPEVAAPRQTERAASSSPLRSPTHVGERLSGAGLAGVVVDSTAGARAVSAHLRSTGGIRWGDV